MTHSINDNEPLTIDTGAVPSDSNGMAAILLVESLIHGLIARSIITVNDAIDIIDVAGDVMQESAEGGNGADRPVQTPLSILEGIAASLGHDVPET